MRARQPDREGYTVRKGVRLHWEVHRQGTPTVFLLPAWSIIHSRHWKFQVADLARHCRVLVMDGRGNGLSDRPLDQCDESRERGRAGHGHQGRADAGDRNRAYAKTGS